MNADTLLARLQHVRQAGDRRWTARCPAHDDKSPSLSIRDTGDRVLIHCFVGCDPVDILSAIGLEWNDLYPDPWDAAALRPNKAARKYAQRTMAEMNPLDLERKIIQIGDADMLAGKVLNMEDRARYALAQERLA